ncbi:uncharacterized protein K02A2.6-like [Macrosteles quadrilineatus]|uniref:uncharacterized protein K02A2.6-like n=1 Tax=Macrosteles quadrilineatus TaxID=74068 RepID=UPI0023E1C029|nr:uncharacterized protein K02A2.6-like [Macrosteles quadrilineatus]
MDIEEVFIKLKIMLRQLKPISLSNSTQEINGNASNSTGNTASTFHISFVPYSEDESFDNFTKRLEVFMHLKHISDETTKTFTLLNALPPTLHQKLYNICTPETPLQKDYDDLIALLKQYLDPQPSVWARQHNFIVREQMVGESVTDFTVELKKLVTPCEFKCSCGKSTAETMLRLQFIRGLRDAEIRTKLLQVESDKTFQEVINTAKIMELSKTENTMITSSQHKAEINQVISNTTNKQFNTNSEMRIKSTGHNNSSFTFQSLKGKCYRCGDEKHKANKCKFTEHWCRKCGKMGHIARVCLSENSMAKFKNLRNTCQADVLVEEDESYEMNLITSKNSDKFNLEVNIEGNEITMELDTGAALSTISYKDYMNLGLNKSIHKTKVELRTYTGEVFEPVGYVFVKCTYKNHNFIGKLYVINRNVDPIFGRDWIREVKLDWADIRSITSSYMHADIDRLIENYKDVFEQNIGVIPEVEGHIQLLEDAKPVYMKPRLVPYALRPKVEEELDRLEKIGIISKVEQSDWGTPIVPVVKPSGKIRICADFKVTLNKQIKDIKYPIPRIEDIFAKMSGGKYFCTLDISNAYLHMAMDQESALLQTISTHKGQYKVNRLMFGIKTAPALWQGLMDKILSGIDGVQCFFDDIIIQGSTESEALTRLESVLKVIRRHNLKLNKDKCKFFQTQIDYLGHTIDQNGLHKNKDKVEAILKSPKPSNVSELRTFLGLTNYYQKFIPNLNTILNPLHNLLKAHTKFVWTRECDKCVEKVKAEIASDRVLAHFDENETLVLATDASPVGLGIVLSHRYKDGTERPISFASRSLTASEKKYSQIDKEALAIYWGLKKFYHYCYGRKFILVTDHKPLVSIFDPYRTLPTMTATRIFNYAHFLSGFDYTIEYRNTKSHGNADYMSRFPNEHPPTNQIDQHKAFFINQIESMPVTHENIANETSNDNELKPLLKALQDGTDLEHIGLKNNEYSLHDGCIFRGSRVVIPEKLQGKVLNELHLGHLGVVKMKNLARSFCYWKHIDRNIEDLAKSCRPCCLKQNLPEKVDVHPWLVPSGPWQRIHIDFAGPIYGQYLFVIVDAYSKWVEVIPTKTTTSNWCIQQLRKLFSTFGYPFTLVSDNGPNFTSSIFNQFLQACGVTHKFSAPYHPATNGQAERFVQTVKKQLIAMENDGGDLHFKINHILMSLRNATNATGSSAYELMFGRRIRTRLDLMKKPQDHTEMPDGCTKIKREFRVGDRVQMRNFGKDGKWKFGNVRRREGLVHYQIEMDNGQVWRRHINHIRPCKFEGED